MVVSPCYRTRQSPVRNQLQVLSPLIELFSDWIIQWLWSQYPGTRVTCQWSVSANIRPSQPGPRVSQVEMVNSIFISLSLNQVFKVLSWSYSYDWACTYFDCHEESVVWKGCERYLNNPTNKPRVVFDSRGNDSKIAIIGWKVFVAVLKLSFQNILCLWWWR